MANWCSNEVVFDGQPNLLLDLKMLFEMMMLKEQRKRKGQLPEFIKEQNGFLFDIRWEDDVLYYATKWSPNTAVLQDIADLFGVGFVHSYEETANHIYGEATYKDSILTETSLDDEDFDLYDFDADNDTYSFENENYESNSEILEILIERKKAIKTLQQ